MINQIFVSYLSELFYIYVKSRVDIKCLLLLTAFWLKTVLKLRLLNNLPPVILYLASIMKGCNQNKIRNIYIFAKE